MPARLPLLLLLLLLGACGGGGGGSDPGTAPGLGPAPDVVLLTVSGRNTDFDDLFCPPGCNQPYLGDPGDAGEAIFTELAIRDLTVEVRHYIAAWDDYGGPKRYGCRTLIADLRRIDENWPDARIVLVGHSHGCVWAHTVAAAVADVEIDLLVSLDGVSAQWEDDHAASLTAWFDANGGNPYPFDLRDVTASWSTAAGDRDTKDVAFGNVVLNVEVQSNDFLVTDNVDNVRLDGGEDGIARLASMESHGGVHQPGTESMNFVLDRLVVALLGP